MIENLTFKREALRVAKSIGLFRLARWWTARDVRILCYHGLNLDDEGEFRESMYIEPALLRKRVDFLHDASFPIMTIAEMDRRKRNDTLPDCCTVVTFDDGWYSTFRAAFPIIRDRGMTATVYVTSYYVQKQKPVFGICIDYLLWKSTVASFRVSELGFPIELGTETVNLHSEAETSLFADCLRSYGQSRCDQVGRDQLLCDLADILDVDLEKVLSNRVFNLMTDEELSLLISEGWDVQLHTHCHDLPEDEAKARSEIEENRKVLSQLSNSPLEHFCYPSGKWNPSDWTLLESCNIRTATTCDPGLVKPGTDRLAMPRIVDNPHISDIEFEAEMYGFTELVRRTIRLFRWATRSYERQSR